LQKATTVFLASDSSEGAASAAHAALPYLKAAKEVVVGCIGPVMTNERDGQDPGTDVAGWLSHHGCKVTVSQFPSGGRDIGRCVLARAQEIGADLVIMGGTTRSMIEQTNLPVFLAH
jgi:nucleotide-binding universal stress UspA family protein